ncbi:MAG: PxxKW family cysteine-rich protein [Deltaproteobacteria bacterium]|nr:PxxKW family cysteine-rich protein [Deltaproteobacteria bacterium]MBW1994977.1 PxxKW family cysteine-rich protein [Deltaproteobacteria bacterium]MBW2152068.1 PxxKW family cysteine-rich protein [Deltaproteobacteria bacterium]
MICETIRKGTDCPFMTAKGCSYNGGICHEIIDNCKGCNRTKQFSSGWYCTAWPDPSLKWKTGNCNMASHLSKETSSARSKINPLKASKRGRR